MLPNKTNLIQSSSIFLTGLLAGVFFTWTNAIAPGIGALNDLAYLSSFQAMNRSILNPLFYIVFMGPFFLMGLSFYLIEEKQAKNKMLLAFVIYFFGVFVVTLLGNIPLNEMLDVVNLAITNEIELSRLRASFEKPWNQLHLVRTVASTLSFSILLLSSYTSKNHY